MGHFVGNGATTPPDIATGMRTLVDRLEFVTDIGGSVVVPAGFKTDLASVPRWLWPILPAHGLHEKAAIVHDFLYGRNREGKPLVTRWTADALFRQGMASLGVSAWRRWLMWAGVRLGGWQRGAWQAR